MSKPQPAHPATSTLRLIVRRSGGVAGLSRTGEFVVDAARLGEDDRRELEAAVAEAGVHRFPARVLSIQPVPDQVEYRLTIETADATVTTTIQEHARTPAIRRLIDLARRLTGAGHS